jgi:selenocysteine lyase/cysteine desulfurase
LADLEAAGLDAVAHRIGALTGRLRAGLAERGYSVHSPAGPDVESGIVSFTHPTLPSQAVVDELARLGCHVSQPDGLLRASPHYWTSDLELEDVLTALGDLASIVGQTAD